MGIQFERRLTMGNDQARRLTFGAMMAALFALLTALTYYVPVIGAITVLVIPLPLALYGARYSRGPSLTVSVAGVVLSFLIAGPGGLLLALLNAPVGFIIGDGVRTGKTKLYIFMASGLAVLIMGVLQFAAAAAFMNINIISELTDSLRAYYEQTGELMKRFDMLPDDYDQIVNQMILMVQTLIPSMFIIVSYLTAFITVSIIFPLMRKLGTDVPKFGKFRNLKFPVVLLFYYAIILIVSLLAKPEAGSTGYLIIGNAMLILRVLFFMQGLSLLAFAVHATGIPKWLFVPAVLLAIPLSPIVVLLGILDVGFNIRGFITGSKGK